MQAKAVVVVERVCGTLHTDTTEEIQTCGEGGEEREEGEGVVILTRLVAICPPGPRLIGPVAVTAIHYVTARRCNVIW